MGTTLESGAEVAGDRFLADRGWDKGKHT
jgi:hypothetical protein